MKYWPWLWLGGAAVAYVVYRNAAGKTVQAPIDSTAGPLTWWGDGARTRNQTTSGQGSPQQQCAEIGGTYLRSPVHTKDGRHEYYCRSAQGGNWYWNAWDDRFVLPIPG